MPSKVCCPMRSRARSVTFKPGVSRDRQKPATTHVHNVIGSDHDRDARTRRAVPIKLDATPINGTATCSGRTPAPRDAGHSQFCQGRCQDICREFRQVPTSIVQNRPIGIIPVVDSWWKHRRMASSSWIFVSNQDSRRVSKSCLLRCVSARACSSALDAANGTSLIASDMSLKFAP